MQFYKHNEVKNYGQCTENVNHDGAGLAGGSNRKPHPASTRTFERLNVRANAAIMAVVGVMIITLIFSRRTKTKFDELYRAHEDLNGLPHGLLYAIAAAESAHNPAARSPAGALGLFQIMPKTAAELGVNPLNPEQAADGAARYIKKLHTKFGTWAHALMAYNWGQGNVSAWLKEQRTPGAKVRPVPKETRDYLGRILGKF